MWNPFRRRRSRVDSANQTDASNEEPKNTQDVFAQTSSTEFPALKKASTVEVSTSTSLVDRKSSNQPSNLSRISERELKDTAVNTSNTLFPAPSKDSKVYVSTSSQWEDNGAFSNQKSSILSHHSTKQSIQDEPHFKDATMQTSTISAPPHASQTQRYSFPEKSGEWVGGKSDSSWRFGDHQERNSGDLTGLSLQAPAPLYISSPRDEEKKELKMDKPVVIFPADKPGIFFMPGITNIPLMAPFPFPPFFPPPIPPPNLSFPMPPLGIKSLPLIQPIRQTKRKASAQGPREEAAVSPAESSQDTSQTQHSGRQFLTKDAESHRKKGRGEDYDADFSNYLFKEPRNREETDSYICKCHQNPKPEAPAGLYSGDEVPSPKRTFICRKHRTAGDNQTYICSATGKSCECQKNVINVKQKPPVCGSQTTFCANCQCCHCCLPDSTVATSRCGFITRNVCDGSLVEENLSHINASMFRSVQVSLRSSNGKRNSKVKKYNFSLETLKILGSLFSGARGTSLNCREVKDCRRRAECYCAQNRLVMDHACSAAVHQTPTTAPCPCEAASPSPSLKPKESISSKLKSSSFGRHLKQLLTNFDRDLNNLPGKFQSNADADECGKVDFKFDSPCPNVESKCVDTEDNDIKCNSVPFTSRRRNTILTFGDDDMFTSEVCAKVYNDCREIQDRCGQLVRAKKTKCYKMSTGSPDCFENLIHCCGCKCECCRIKANGCRKEIKGHKEVCSVYSQTDITFEKESKNTNPEDNEDSTQIFQPTVLDTSPPQEETHSLTTEEYLDIETDLPKIWKNSEDTKCSVKPTTTCQNDENSDVSTIDQPQKNPATNKNTAGISKAEGSFPSEQYSYSNKEDDFSKPSDDISKEMKGQESDPEIIVKSAGESKVVDDSPTYITDWKTESQTQRRPYIDRCRDYQQQDVNTYHQPEPPAKEKPPCQPKGSYEDDNFKPSIFCAIKHKYANKKDIKFMEEYENKRRDVCDEYQKNDTRHPRGVCMPQPPCSDTAEDVEPAVDDKPEEDSEQILEPISDRDSSQEDYSDGIVYAMSNNKFKDTADIRLFRSTFSSQGDSREQSTICNLPDLESELSEMLGQQDRLNDISQLLRMQSSTNHVSQPHDESDILLHGDSEQVKRKNSFNGKKDGEKIKGNDTFTSKNDCQQVKRNSTFTSKNDNQETKRNNIFTCNKDNKEVKQNNTVISKNGGQQINRQNTFTCRKRKHHDIESYVQDVPVALEEKNTFPFQAGRCTKKNIHCSSKGDFVKPTHASDNQIKQGEYEQYTVTKSTGRSRNANLIPAPSIPSKTESKTFQLPNIRRCRDGQNVEVDILKQDDSPNVNKYKDRQNVEVGILKQQRLPNVRRCRDRQNVEVDNFKQDDFQLPNDHKSMDSQNEEKDILKQVNLPNVHQCEEFQDDEVDILKQSGLPRVRRCRDRNYEEANIPRQEDIQLPNVHKCKDCQDDESDILKQDDFQLINCQRCKDCQEDEIDILKGRGLPNVRRCRDRQNEEANIQRREDFHLPNVHKCKDSQDDESDILNQDDFQLPNVHRCRDSQNEKVDILKQCGLPNFRRCRDRQNEEVDIPKQDDLPDVHKCKDCLDDAGDILKLRRFPNVRRCRDRQIVEVAILKQDDLTNVHKSKDRQNEEGDILKQRGLPNVRRCRARQDKVADIITQDDFQLPNVHKSKDRQNEEDDILKQNDFQLPNVHTCKDCFDDEVDVLRKDDFQLSNIHRCVLQQHGLPNVCRCRECENEEADILRQNEDKKLNVRRSKDCQEEEVDIPKQQDVPNVPSPKDCQINEDDIIRRHELHIDKGYISYRKQLNIKREHDGGKVTLIYTLKNKHAYLKAIDNTQGFEGRQDDIKDYNQQDKRVDSSCRVCRSRSSSVVKTEDTEAPDIDKETEVTAEVSKKGLQSNKPNIIRKTDSSKAEDSVGIACPKSRSKQKDTADVKLFGSVFSRKDNSQDQSTTCNLSDLDSEMSEAPVPQNLLNDISGSCSKQFGPNHCRCRDKQRISLKDPSNFDNEGSPRKGKLGNNVSNDSSPSKGELGNNVSNYSSPSKGELRNNVRNYSSPSKGELGNNVSNYSSSSKGELGNNVSNYSSSSKGELGNNVSNYSSPSKGKLGNNGSNYSSSSKGELGNNGSNKTSKINLDDRAAHQNCEELNNMVIRDSILNKQEEDNEDFNHDVRSHRNSRYIDSAYDIQGHRHPSYTDFTHDVRNRDPSYIDSNHDIRSHINQRYIDSNHNVQIRDPSCIYSNPDLRSHRDPSYIDSNYDVRNHRDPSYIDSNYNVRSHRKTNYKDSYHDVRRHNNHFHADTNHKAWKYRDPSEAKTNNKDRKKNDVNDPDHNHTHQEHNDPVKADQRRENEKHRDLNNADAEHGDWRHTESSDGEPNYNERKHVESTSAEPNYKVRNHEKSSDAKPNYKDGKNRESSDEEPNYNERKHVESTDAEPSYKVRNHEKSSDAKPNYKDGKHRESSDGEHNYKDRKHRESSDGEHNYKDRKHRETSDGEPNCKDRKHRESSDGEPNYKDRKHRESSDGELNCKDRKHRESSDGELNYKDRKHRDSSDGELSGKDRKHRESSDAEPNYKERKHNGSSDAKSSHKQRKHKESKCAEPNYQTSKHNEPFVKDRKHRESSDTRPSHKSRRPKDLLYADYIDKDEKDKVDPGHGASSRTHSNHTRQNHEASTVSHSVSFSDAGKQRLETHNNIKCTINQTALSVETETNILPVTHNSFHDAPSSPHAEERQEIAERPCINCHCRKKKTGNKYTVISDEDASITSKSYQSVKRKYCQIYQSPCFKCVSPKGKETHERETNYLNQCPNIEGVQENKSRCANTTCQSLSESQGFPRKLFMISASRTGKRKHQINRAQPHKWQPKEIYPHFHSSDSSQLQISSNSLCQDKGKPCPSRNRSPEYCSNSFGSSSEFNGYTKCQSGKHLAAFGSQCQNLAFQCDSCMGVHAKQLSPQMCSSLSQCVDSIPKESSESSREAGCSRTESRTCCFKLRNLIPCRTCGQIKGVLRSQNCCHISSTSVV